MEYTDRLQAVRSQIIIRGDRVENHANRLEII